MIRLRPAFHPRRSLQRRRHPARLWPRHRATPGLRERRGAAFARLLRTPDVATGLDPASGARGRCAVGRAALAAERHDREAIQIDAQIACFELEAEHVRERQDQIARDDEAPRLADRGGSAEPAALPKTTRPDVPCTRFRVSCRGVRRSLRNRAVPACVCPKGAELPRRSCPGPPAARRLVSRRLSQRDLGEAETHPRRAPGAGSWTLADRAAWRQRERSIGRLRPDLARLGSLGRKRLSGRTGSRGASGARAPSATRASARADIASPAPRGGSHRAVGAEPAGRRAGSCRPRRSPP